MFNKTAEIYDLMYSLKDYEQESLQIRDYINSLNPKATHVLDVACGTGKHASYLSRFYNVDGIDLNERFIDIALERNSSGTFVCRDMTSFQLDKQYDIVMCLFSSIAYVKTFDLLVESLNQFKHHLNNGGIVIVEPWFQPNAWEVGRVDMFTTEDEQGNKVCRMSHSEKAGAISILNFEYLIGTTTGIEKYTEKHELGLFTVEEMITAFESAGFVCQYDPNGISGRGLYVGIMS